MQAGPPGGCWIPVSILQVTWVGDRWASGLGESWVGGNAALGWVGCHAPGGGCSGEGRVSGCDAWMSLFQGFER